MLIPRSFIYANITWASNWLLLSTYVFNDRRNGWGRRGRPRDVCILVTSVRPTRTYLPTTASFTITFIFLRYVSTNFLRFRLSISNQNPCTAFQLFYTGIISWHWVRHNSSSPEAARSISNRSGHLSGSEITYCWRHRHTWSARWFFLNRYLSFLGNISVTILGFYNLDPDVNYLIFSLK